MAFALATAGCGSLVLANRTPERATELACALAGAGLPAPVVYRLGDAGMRSEVEAADLVLNTTSLGMWPRVEETPLPPDWFRPGQWVYDLVYNPLETKFLAGARRRGCRVISGLDMLLYQGAAAFTLWTGREAPVAVMDRVLREAMGASSGGPAAGR